MNGSRRCRRRLKVIPRRAKTDPLGRSAKSSGGGAEPRCERATRRRKWWVSSIGLSCGASTSSAASRSTELSRATGCRATRSAAGYQRPPKAGVLDSFKPQIHRRGRHPRPRRPPERVVHRVLRPAEGRMALLRSGRRAGQRRGRATAGLRGDELRARPPIHQRSGLPSQVDAWFLKINARRLRSAVSPRVTAATA